MKKLVTFFAMACFAVTAQAVTYYWDYATTISTTRADSGWYAGENVSIDGTKNFAVKVALTFNADADANWFNNNANGLALLTVGSGGSEQVFTAYRNSNNTSVWSKGPGSKTLDGSSALTVKGGTYDLIFAYDAATNTMTMTYDGVVFATATSDDLPTDGFGQIDKLYFASRNSSGNDNWSGVSRNDSWSVSSIQYTVPEPTALALLALGVAGLALKRKVK